ncbi:MAG: MlaD family protein [Planctomycetota bacterium]
MEDRNVKWRVGVVAVATVVITALLIAVSTTFETPFGVGQYRVQIMVKRAPGVGRNTPIRRDGVLIGRVDSTEPVAGGRLITARINQSEPILASDRIQIRPSSLFGDAVIEFAQSGDEGPQVEPGATLQGRALPDPIETLTALDVGPAVDSLGRAGESVAELATRINTIIGEQADGQRLDELLDKATLAMDDFSRTMQQVSEVAAALDGVIGDQQVQQDLKQALADAPAFMSEIRGVAQQAATTITTLDSAIVSAERNLKNIEGLTKPIGERGPELAQSVISALENLDVALADISRFAKALNDSEGTVGQLVNNPELYNNVNTTVCNANLVIARINELAKQLRPILQDVRVFTDKVAREPGRLVGGALNKSPGIK